jgi:hypothetical protein
MASRFINFEQAAESLRGKSIAVVGSAPSVLDNAPGFIDSHDIVVRVNNYKTGAAQGTLCDVHYSFYGTSIRKRAEDLQADGVQLCMCKCPNARALESAWHEANNKINGIDFRYIYHNRKDWWFTDTFIPSVEHFLRGFELLGKHIPTTGFSAILDVLACEPGSVYLTGFDFFTSGLHNVDEAWKPGNPNDPICHRPDLEMAWLRKNLHKHPVSFDKKLGDMLVHNPLPPGEGRVGERSLTSILSRGERRQT